MRWRVSARDPSGAVDGRTSTFGADFSPAAARATSDLVTRGPDGITFPNGTPCSRANLRADGVAEISGL